MLCSNALIGLGQVLERRDRQTCPRGNGSCNLRTREHVWLFPAVDEIPFPRQHPIEMAIPHQVGTTIESHLERLKMVGFRFDRLDSNPAQIASKRPRRDRGDLPFSTALHRHLVRQPTIGGNDVGMANRQETPGHAAPSPRLAAAGRA